MVATSQPIDADNHYYEALDAFTRHLDPKFRQRGVRPVQEGKRVSLLMGGKVNTFIPNPTFNPIIVPGCLDPLFRGQIPEGVDPASIDLLARRCLPAAWVSNWAAAPDARVLHDDGGWITNAELDDRSRRVAGCLAGAGLRAGDRVVMSAATSATIAPRGSMRPVASTGLRRRICEIRGTDTYGGAPRGKRANSRRNIRIWQTNRLGRQNAPCRRRWNTWTCRQCSRSLKRCRVRPISRG